MEFHYEIKNPKLKKLVENKAKKLNISVDEVIWRYVYRGLMGDGFTEEVFEELHSEEYMAQVNEALNVD